MKPLIMIGCPVRDRAWILPEYLDHIYKLDHPKEQIILGFIVNDCSDNTAEVLKDWQSLHQHEYRTIITLYRTLNQVPDARVAHIRKRIYSTLAQLRNELLDLADSMGVDYLFSVDSDILVPPDALNKLIEDDKDIVAAQIWNDASKIYPNILLSQGNEFRHYFNFPKDSLFRCDVTGAVYLLKRKVLGCRYGHHDQGEDIAFCVDAAKKGFEIWADSRVYCQHIMQRKRPEI